MRQLYLTAVRPPRAANLAQDLARFLQTFVLLNIYKEAGRCVMVSAAYYLTVTDIMGSEVNRDIPSAVLVGFQAFMAVTFRLEINNFDDSRVALVTCLLQGVLEVALRLTAPERDAFLTRLRVFTCACRGRGRRNRRATSLVVVEPAPQTRAVSGTFGKRVNGLQVTSARIAKEHERLTVIRQFHARIVLLDMWGEFAGIYIGSVILALGQRNAMRYPFRPYRMHAELFDGGNFYLELLFTSAVQVAIEIATDTVCLVFQGRGRLDAWSVWRGLPRRALMPVAFWGMLFAAVTGSIRSSWGDSLTACNYQQVCNCVGRGLLPGGVREAYCMMLYANTSGVPPA